jgi:hypothetical protein
MPEAAGRLPDGLLQLDRLELLLAAATEGEDLLHEVFSACAGLENFL